MRYSLFKLRFSAAVHFGSGGLTKTQKVIYADTLFSALCSEAVKMGDQSLQCLINAVENDRLFLTDGLPYIGDILYVPKPLMRLKFESDGDSEVKKATKKLKYVPVDKLDAYLSGSLDLKAESTFFSQSFGTSVLVEKAAVKDGDDSEPYAVEVFRYKENSGLYICVGYEREEEHNLVRDLLMSLSLNGIGGKISSGYGQFDLFSGTIPDSMMKRLERKCSRYMTLSVSLPSDNEMERILPRADYKMLRRGGFIASVNYADTLRKKRDVYMLAAGSTFTEPFVGELLDLSDHDGSHPVYRFAKPFLMGVTT